MFVANACRPFSCVNRRFLQYLVTKIPLGLTCLVVIVGAYGQIHDSLVPPVSAWSDLHAGFGALLLSTLGMQMLARFKDSVKMPPIGIYVAMRQLARSVYLLLYALAGLKEMTNVVVYLWQGGTLDFGGIIVGNPRIGAAPLLHTMDSFQPFIGYGIIAVLVIRLQAESLRRQIE